MTKLVNSFLLIAALFTATAFASEDRSPKQLLESVTADLFVDIANVNAKRSHSHLHLSEDH